MRKHSLAASVLAAAILASCTKEIQSDATATPTEQNVAGRANSDLPENAAPGAYVPNELLVKFKAGTGETARNEALSRVSAQLKERILTKAMQRLGDGEAVYLVHTPLEVTQATARLRGLGEVEYAEPNYIYTHAATSNDPYYTNGSLWGMYGDGTSPANQYGCQAGEAWAAGHTGSSSVVVGVIDEGIQYNHPDLQANIWVNPYDKQDGVDNDGNGYVDDVYGWDFANNDASTYDGGTRGSLDKHGTHVSGTIGGSGANGTGVAGVTWNVKIISSKFLGRNGGTTANAIKAVDYLTDLKTRHGIDLVASNNSWGGGGFSQALLDAIARGAAANILFIAAAGNGGSDGVGDNNDAVASYPSNYNTNGVQGASFDAVIAVAAITSSGARSSFSNYGANTVDIGAPGSGINSSLPYNTYGSYSGTSMATPHVTGGAALRAGHSSERGAALKATILNSAVSTASLSGKCTTGGRLNVSGF
jgi:subtilisin family serine protease